MGNESGTIAVKPNKISLYFGIAAADKDYNSRELKVYVTEFLPYQSGKLEATEVKSKVGTEDSRSDGGEGEATLTNTITAQYADLFTNRTFPPDIRKGEQVFLFNVGDSDTYYWFSMGRNDNLRRCEKLRFAVSDDVKFEKELDNDNTWFIEINTLPKDDGSQRKELLISTSKSDREEFRYLIKVDAVANTFQFNDDDNNLFLMESKEKRMFMRNTEGTCVDLIKKNLSASAVEDLILKAGRQVIIDAPLLTNQQEKKEKTTQELTKDKTFVCENSFVINAPHIGFNCEDLTICGKVFIKELYVYRSGIVELVKCPDSGSSDSGGDGGSVSSFLTKASALFGTAQVVQTDSDEPIEENRPKELKEDFSNGWDAKTLRDDVGFCDSIDPPKVTATIGATIDTVTATVKEGATSVGDGLLGAAGRAGVAWDQITSALDRVSVSIQNIRGAIDSVVDQVSKLGGDNEVLKSVTDLTKLADKLGVEARVLGVNSAVTTAKYGS